MSNFKAWNYDDDLIVGWDSANVNSAYNNQVSGIIKFAEDLACEKVGNLEVRLKAGLVISAGILGKIPKGQTEAIKFKALNDGQSRIDIICFKTYKENGRIVGDIVVVEGAASSGVAIEPTITKGDIEMGANENYTALYRISLNGPNIRTVELMAKVIKHNLDELITNLDGKADKIYVDAQDLKNLSIEEFLKEKFIINENLGKKLNLTGGLMSGVINTDINLPLISTSLIHKTHLDNELKLKLNLSDYNTKVTELATEDKRLDTEIKKVAQSQSDTNNTLSGKVSKNGDTMSGPLNLPPANPSGDYTATHKNYVDVQDSKKVDLTTYNAKMTTLDLKNSTQDTDIGLRATKVYVDQEVLKQVSKVGDTMTGMLNLPSTSPTLGTHATTKSYVDTRDALKADLIYVDTKLNEKLSLAVAEAWQKYKVSADNGSSFTIPDKTTWAQYFQLNNNMLRHISSLKAYNTDAPIDIEGIAGNAGSVSTANPSGKFWALGVDKDGKLYGTHSKGDNTTTVAWQRYLDGRDYTILTNNLNSGLATKLNLTGGTLTGQVRMPHAPTDPAHLVNQYYVDAGQRHQLTDMNGKPFQMSGGDAHDIATGSKFINHYGGGANLPKGGQGILQRIKFDNTVASLIDHQLGTNDIYIQSLFSTWKPWKRVLTHEDNIDYIVYSNSIGVSGNLTGTPLTINVDVLDYEKIVLQIDTSTSAVQLDGSLTLDGYAECNVSYRGLSSEIYYQVCKVRRLNATQIQLFEASEGIIVNGSPSIVRNMANIRKIGLLRKRGL